MSNDDLLYWYPFMVVCEDHYFSVKTGMAGQMITAWTCEKCDGSYSHGNTAIPNICIDCAVKHRKCQYCE